jgi:hypothetical protein
VGLGAGITAGAVGLYDVDRLTGLEIEKGVFVASRFFEKENHGLLDNPKLDVRIDDGRNFLKLTKERFDVISSAPNFPSLTGSGGLYSTDFFKIARDRLAPGGVMCQFAPIWRMQPQDVRTIVGSFTDVFPYVRVFNTGLSLVMLGRLEAFPPVDVAELTRRVEDPAVKKSLREIASAGRSKCCRTISSTKRRLGALLRERRETPTTGRAPSSSRRDRSFRRRSATISRHSKRCDRIARSVRDGWGSTRSTCRHTSRCRRQRTPSRTARSHCSPDARTTVSRR